MILAEKDCFVCNKHAQGSASSGFIQEDRLVYAGHILPPDLTDAYLGYLMIEPKRHVTGLGELTDEEAAGLGVLGNKLARALKDNEGAEHVYSFVIGHEVSHLHIHLAPRYPGTPTEYWGSRIGQWPDAPRGDVADITAICARLRGALSTV